MNRILQMREMWKSAITKEPKMVCWQVKTSEESMVDGFYLLEESNEQSEFPEIFFQLDDEFNDYQSYSKNLVESLKYMHDESVKYIEEKDLEGIQNWIPLHQEWTDEEKYSPKYFIDNLSHMIDCLEGYKFKYWVCYLSPSFVHDFQAWGTWLEDILRLGVPGNILFMVKDYQEYEYLSFLKGRKKIQFIRPDLKIYEAMKQEARGGREHDPGVQFRVAFIEMSEAAGKKYKKGLKHWGGQCVQIAQKMSNKELESVSYLSIGTHLFNLGKTKEALESYQKALALNVDIAEEKGQETADRIAIQVYAGIGSIYFLSNKYSEASEAYDGMFQKAHAVGDGTSELEGLRMLTICEKKQYNTREAYEVAYKGHQTAMQLPRETLKYSTYPMLAQMYFNLCSEIAPKRLKEAELEIIDLIGDDWQNISQHSVVI